MTEPINNNLNPAGIANTNIGQPTKQEAKTQEKQEQTTPSVETKNVPEADIWSYMGGLATQNNVKLSPSAMVAKYNTPEQVARITGDMLNEFIPGVVAELPKFEKELGAVFTNLSEADKLALGAESFASQEVE